MLVVDSSFVVAAIIEEEHTPFADACLRRHAEDGFMAPVLLRWEFANVLNVKVRRGMLTPDQARGLVATFEGLDIVLPLDETPLDALLDRAAFLSLTVYDTAYVSLALEMNADLATLDRAMADAGRRAGLVVHSPFA